MAAFRAALILLSVAANADQPVDIYKLRTQVLSSQVVQNKIAKTCRAHKKMPQCESRASDSLFCELLARSHPDMAAAHCGKAKAKAAKPAIFLQLDAKPAPEDQLAKEMTHDLEMNFNKIAPFGKEDTAKELQDHA